jgi:DNA-binding XRE family transcriptional regulator
MKTNVNAYARVEQNGVVTHYLVPTADMQQLLRAGDSQPASERGSTDDTFAWTPTAAQADFSRRVLADSSTTWDSGDELMMQLITDGVRDMRERYGMTQQQLADAIDVTQPHVSRLEQELDGVPLRLLRRLAAVFAERAKADERH